MHVFVTGATGLVGSAVVAELIDHGHTVLALSRSETSSRAIEAAGATPLSGTLGDADVLRAGAAQTDGVIHLAFSHELSGPEGLATAIAQETSALETLGDALVGSGRPIVTVSGTPIVANRASTESDPLMTDGPVGGRGRAVGRLLGLASRDVRSVAVRLPRTVHHKGAGGFAGILSNIARRDGVAGFPGDGAQRWPAVHALDAASLFRLALEQADAGTAWHAVADEGDTVRDIATVIGRRLGLPVQSVPGEKFGPFAPIFMADQPSSSAHTRQTLGWAPVHPGLLSDLENILP